MQTKNNPHFHWTRTKSAIAIAVCGATLGFAPVLADPATPSAAKQAVLPGDDFYGYVNGAWMDATEIPADRSSWGAFAVLAEDSNARLVKLIEAVGADKSAAGDNRRVGDFYAAYMDEAGIEARGTAPLGPMLKAIDSIKDKAALARALGDTLRADVDPLNATNFSTENIFGLWVAQNLNDPKHYMSYLLQGGLGLPDRAYYLSDNPHMAELRTKYQEHIAATFKLAGMTDTEARAARVFELEKKIAATHASREDSEDVLKANNTWSAKDFAAKAPGLDWKAFFAAAGLGKQQTFMIWHPSAVTGEAKLVADTDLATWKDYLSFHLVNHASYLLPKAFVDQHFAFYGKALSGTPQLSPRWKRGLAATDAALSEPVGHLYVEKYFPAADKARVQKMVDNIIAAFSRRIEKLEWMAPSTRAQAQAKLKTLYVGVAYPDKWVAYDGLKVTSTDAFGNAMRAERFHLVHELAKLGKPVDRTEWAMPPQLVNAVNMPLQNAINFPAAILQPPFYDPKASDAINYGAIGSVIGHEISHSFDDQGAQFDSEGRLRNWWTADDASHFKTAAGALAAQFSAYKPFPDLNVNGQQTLSENLADLAGLNASLDAFHASLGGKATLEDDRQFFIGYAQSRRTKAREAALRRQIVTDGHAPSQYRTATVRNLDAWYQAFDVQPGQALYLAPADRVSMW